LKSLKIFDPYLRNKNKDDILKKNKQLVNLVGYLFGFGFGFWYIPKPKPKPKHKPKPKYQKKYHTHIQK
jgi:hypothetical protein